MSGVCGAVGRLFKSAGAVVGAGLVAANYAVMAKCQKKVFTSVYPLASCIRLQFPRATMFFSPHFVHSAGARFAFQVRERDAHSSSSARER